MGSAGGVSAWVILLWSLLGLAAAVIAAILVIRAGHARHAAVEPQASDAAAVKEAKDALRLRYASGQISREEYLQGKIELED